MEQERHVAVRLNLKTFAILDPVPEGIEIPDLLDATIRMVKNP
jgi:hypothetical protein